MGILKRYDNLIGSAGNFEYDTDDNGIADGLYWGDDGAYSIGDEFFTAGLRSQRVETLSTDTIPTQRFVRAHSIAYEAGKTYLIACDVYTDGIARTSLYAALGGLEVEKNARIGYKQDFLFVVVTAQESGDDGQVTLYNNTTIPTASVADFDGFRMYEITEEEAELIEQSSTLDVSLRYRFTETFFMGVDVKAFNTNNPLLGERLYDRLPRIYHQMDVEQKPIAYPLKRFFQIAGVGLEFLKEKIDGHLNMYDPLSCPPELLPYLFRLSGFEPPNFLSEDRRRAFLKVLPKLYQTKGSRQVFEYLGRTIFGNDSEFVAASREGNNIIIDLSIVLDGAAPDLNVKVDQFRYLAEMFRPVNRSLNVVAVLMYSDIYERVVHEEEGRTEISVMELDDSYNRAVKVVEEMFRDEILYLDTDVYSKPFVEEDFAEMTVTPDSDTYTLIRSDSYTDELYQTNSIGSNLGKMRLGQQTTLIQTIHG